MEVSEAPEMICCMLICMLEVPKVMRCVLFRMLEAVKGMSDVLKVIRCVLLCIAGAEGVEVVPKVVVCSAKGGWMFCERWLDVLRKVVEVVVEVVPKVLEGCAEGGWRLR